MSEDWRGHGFYDFYREKERLENVAVRVSVEGGPIIWEDAEPQAGPPSPPPPYSLTTKRYRIGGSPVDPG
jgi:hypothetical protein